MLIVQFERRHFSNFIYLQFDFYRFYRCNTLLYMYIYYNVQNMKLRLN